MVMTLMAVLLLHGSSAFLAFTFALAELGLIFLLLSFVSCGGSRGRGLLALRGLLLLLFLFFLFCGHQRAGFSFGRRTDDGQRLLLRDGLLVVVVMKRAKIRETGSASNTTDEEKACAVRESRRSCS